VIGFHRPAGRVGVRNHVLVLPSVVCSTNAAQRIAEATGAIAITHQHGCLHVGDDLRHTEDALIGVAASPNVGAVVVVGLGCETIQGKRLAARIRERDQRVEFVGIQATGGTARAVEAGCAAVERLRAALDDDVAEPMSADALVIGLDRGDDPLAPAVRAACAERGWRTLTAPAGLTAGEAHVALAGAGAQVVVSLRGPGQAPLGFAVCPVVAVARDPRLFAALHDDFDLEALDDDDPRADAGAFAVPAERIAERVAATAAGAPTASEQRGARDFVLHRLAMTM
jgi:altronate dehydratase large subunit